MKKLTNLVFNKWLASAYFTILTISAQAQSGLSTKDVSDEAVSQIEDLKPLLIIICTIGIIVAMIAGGFKFQSDNSDKGKVIGVTVGVIIFLGIALYAINRL